MPAAAKQFSGYVLDRIVQGEKFWRVRIFTETLGAQSCLVRIAGKNKTTCVPDLFDKAEILLEKPKNGQAEEELRFAKEYRLVHRNSGISRDYTALFSASKFVSVLAKNAFAPESAPALFKLCENALHAFAEKPHADATYFKALWTLAREGGYAVKEDWFENSAFDDRDTISFVLRTPLENLEIDSRDIARCTHRLENWLVHEHQFAIE